MQQNFQEKTKKHERLLFLINIIKNMYLRKLILFYKSHFKHP
jgi:hypothetical protein